MWKAWGVSLRLRRHGMQPKMRHWMWAAIGIFAGGGGGAVLADADTSADHRWVVVHPSVAAHHNVPLHWLFAKHLQQEWGGTFPVYEASPEQADPLLTWAQTQAPQTQSIVVMTDKMALVGEVLQESPRHLDHFAPLLVLVETRWCLFALRSSGLHSAQQVLEHAKKNGRQPRVGMPGASGVIRLWMQGMETRTKSAWRMDDYGFGGSLVQSLYGGADVAVGRCDELTNNAQASKIRIVAKGRANDDKFLPHVPSFTDLGWMPMGNGWLAWVAPKRIPAEERQAMAAMLYKIAQKPEMQAALQQTGQIVVDMNPQQSADYLNTYLKVWTDVGQLLSLGKAMPDPGTARNLLLRRNAGQHD